MVFPTTRLGIVVELYLNGAWVDVSSYVYSRDAIDIKRGLENEGGIAGPSTLSLTLDNRDGRFSPRNPTGTYYGQLTRNTPIRVSVAGNAVRMIARAGGFSAPDTAGLSITSDIDLRVDMACDNWSTLADDHVNVKYGAVGNRSWFFTTNTDGGLRLYWSADGSALLSADSTKRLPKQYGRQAIRATLDVNNGAAGKTVAFYTSDTIAGSWTQLGSSVITAGTTSIFDSTADVLVSPNNGQVYAAKVLQGIAGTERANPDFTAQTSEATSFADAAGNTWGPTNDVEITNRRYRFYGEVSSWPVKWDSSGNDVYCQIEAAGVLRRIGQGDSPAKSTMYQALSTADSIVDYWPLEDASASTQFASANGGYPMTWVGSPTLATSTDFASSSALPSLNNAQLYGRVRAHSVTGQVQLRFLIYIPVAGTTNGAIISRLYTTGTVKYWDLIYATGGILQMKGYDSTDTVVFDSGATAFAMDGKLARVSIGLTQNGGNVDHRIAVYEVGDTGVLTDTGAVTPATSQTVLRSSAVYFDYNGNMDDVVLGQVSLESLTDTNDLYSEVNAYVGETASNRILRLAEDSDLNIRIIGHPDDSEPMGPQLPKTVMDLIREAETTDGGTLYELRDDLGLAYRQKFSLYNRDTTLTLDYDGDDLSSIEPVDDDQNTRNDVTVTKERGSSARAVLEEGPLSIQAPPDGVGRYDTSVAVNAETDVALNDHANWRLHLGTVDEARYPKIGLELARSNFSASERDTIMDMDIGDVLAVTDPPAWQPPDDIVQGTVGYTETLAQFQHDITFNCVPESPYEVGFYDDSEARYSPAEPSTLNSGINSSATSLSVITAILPLWTTSAGQMPFDILIGGERMTVTAISGVASPQTFTVTRSVNGVSKSHSAGAELELARPGIYAL
jgi:hypothetical protein